MTATFKCGHPKVEENTKRYFADDGAPRTRCKACHRKVAREWGQKRRDDEGVRATRLTSRMRRLPEMLDNARRKLAGLEAEARRYGMTHLVEQEEGE